MEKMIDPICGMTVSPETAAGEFEHEGTKYHFCSKGCLEKFAGDPQRFLEPQPEPQQPATADVEYTCPMHPEIVQIGPGSCPICGMALEPRTISLDDEKNPELVDMSRRFWISLALTLPIVLLETGRMFFPLDRSIPAGVNNWIQFALATPVVLWGGLPFFQRAAASIRNVSPNMFTLIAMGTGAAWIYSTVALLFPEVFPAALRDHMGEVPLYFEAAAVITTLVLLGQLLELRARSQTSSAIRQLLGLAPKTARLVDTKGDERDVP